ncbi:MAG: helix-turn-helix transcriptional regulator [Clostridia bacterium]|nr:helix-turn-helix transcriptional regulator [Clostridia bacterium]
MNIYFAEKLKSLRAEKQITQEKLAQYLNVSFQAVSKWETGNTYPDITLLPDIARFFGVTVDELLCVEKIDEKRLFEDYYQKAEDMFRCGDRAGALTLWQEAYKRMPNNIDVKEMLMSSYFDTDREKYFNEFFDLATDIVNGSTDGRAWAMYYKGQAISQLARVFAERGEMKEAQKWARKSVPIFNSMEIIETMIDNGEDLVNDVAFCTYWFLEELFFLACRIDDDNKINISDDYKQRCFITVAQIYEALYKNNDMGFEQFNHLCNLHQGIAKYEAMKKGNEDIIKYHLEKAADFCKKSMSIKEHRLTHPMLYGWQIQNTPSDNKLNIRHFTVHLQNTVYEPYRQADWFIKIDNDISKIMV